jgi:asparagine synthase (glutamine-hydrolysing)
MCGILGLIHKCSYSITNEQFQDLNYLNSNRGPDDQSMLDLNFLQYKLKIGHTRLSIQDLSNNANQPMESFSGRFIISFNGEIYNHLKIRNLLNNKNIIKWKSSSDTETLLNLFEFYEFSNVLNMIEGMFSFMLVDLKEKKIYFARDLAGEKPLYIHFSENYISTSSDLNAIKKFPNFKKDINKAALKNYTEYNYIPYPETIFKNTFKIPPASFIRIDFDKYTFKNFNNFDTLLEDNGIFFDYWWQLKNNKDYFKKINNYDAKETIKTKIKSSIKSQLISDAPLGAFLSAGIDSSLVVSMMQELQSNTKTFTIGYENKLYDESVRAKEIAKYLNTDHESYIFSNSEVIKFIESTPNVFSEPFADSSQLPTLLVSKLARQKVKVVLTGDGGDELFGGYNRYIYANKFWNKYKLINSKLIKYFFINLIKLMPNNFYKFLNMVTGTGLNQYSLDKVLKKLPHINDKLSYYESLIKEWSHKDILSITSDSSLIENRIKKIFDLDNFSFEEKMMLADFHTYLPDDILCKVDRSSMHYSLESRAPFLNKDLIETAFNMPIKYKLNNGNSKIILKNILSDYLPDHLINKSKMGFGIPIGDLMKNDLKKWTKDILSKEVCQKHGYFNQHIVDSTLKNHFDNLENNQYKLWNLIQFNLWFENL